ncbi:MAG: TRAP transporter substrate-binding protein DctP [Treponema sp.]|jgi:TRAP-type C4-dicarboxylate transport system substrate-binding protein|nr:TRAP transporter substrate-binding protein DctP [Treponema sp.]
MKKNFPVSRLFIISCVFFMCFTVPPELLHAQRPRTVTINLASSLPRNSPWGRILDRIAADWAKITNGEVNLHILHQYPGSEGDYLMKLRQDKIQAAILTSMALNSIAPEIMALSVPLLIRDDDEMDAVLKEVRPTLNARIEQEGYINLVWVKAGWVKIFSRSPVFVPNDLRRLKLGTSPDEHEIMDAFKAMGYNLVPVSLPDVPQRLNSGMIDAVYQSPISASAFQLYRVAKNLSPVNLAPFMGGVLMSRKAWINIPEKYRSQLMESARKAGAEIEDSFQKSETDAIADMLQNGLILNEMNAAQEAEWYRDVQGYLPEMANRGIFHKEMYERILGILQNYRQER